MVVLRHNQVTVVSSPWIVPDRLNNSYFSQHSCIYYVLVMQSVDGEHHEKAVELLKAAQGSVKLVVRYTPKVLEEMEARFEKMRSARRRQQHTSYSWDCSFCRFSTAFSCIYGSYVNWWASTFHLLCSTNEKRNATGEIFNSYMGHLSLAGGVERPREKEMAFLCYLIIGIMY